MAAAKAQAHVVATAMKMHARSDVVTAAQIAMVRVVRRAKATGQAQMALRTMVRPVATARLQARQETVAALQPIIRPKRAPARSKAMPRPASLLDLSLAPGPVRFVPANTGPGSFLPAAGSGSAG